VISAAEPAIEVLAEGSGVGGGGALKLGIFSPYTLRGAGVTGMLVFFSAFRFFLINGKQEKESGSGVGVLEAMKGFTNSVEVENTRGT